MRQILTIIFIIFWHSAFSQIDSSKSIKVVKTHPDTIFVSNKNEDLPKSYTSLNSNEITKSQSEDSIWKILIPAIFAIFGILIGNYLNHRNSYLLFQKQKIFDNQRVSFSKIMALKNPWIQSIRTNSEAKLLCEFYETRYLTITHNKEDLEEAKRQNARALELIKDISNYQMQFFETLGLIQTCFKLDKELQTSIDEIYNYKSITVKPFPKTIKVQKQLDELFRTQNELMIKLIDEEYKNKIDKLISLLKKYVVN